MTSGANDATSTSPVVLGVDPGGRTTGMALRRGMHLLWWTLLERHDIDEDRTYLSRVCGVVHTRHLQEPIVVAVEGLNHPSPHLGLANVSGLVATAEVIGALKVASVFHGWQFVEVTPGGHGSAPLSHYPQDLVGTRERTGKGRLRHARSAWDVAGAARFAIAASVR